MATAPLDAFIAKNQPLWDRLALLTRKTRGGVARLPAAEIDEMVRLYQRVSSHLSFARTYYEDPALTAQLSGLVATAGAVVYGTRPRTLRALGRFFSTTFPAAVWHNRAFVAIAAGLFFVPAILIGTWLASSPKAVDAVGTPALREAYLNQDFESYYSSEPAAQFAAKVTTNNIQVGFLAFAGGILLCVPTVLLLVYNGANLGVPAGLFSAAGQNAKFYGLVLPHGLLELTAVVIAGAAGLRLGWTLIDPGDRTRRTALVEEGRRAVVLVLGLVATFLVAGTIEGFVTGSGLPTAMRVGIGVVVELAFALYVVVLGRDAAANGYTGVLDDRRTLAVTTARSPSP
ncbi:MAG TPA: stage II sporulation protein M [Acidimicrobiales bacterium]|nr:stage II sporulation protein M [Acidimicrobiales bacterium]